MATLTTRVRYKQLEQVSLADLLVYNKLPPHPFWSGVESKIDFSFADSLCAVLYTGRGQRPYAPSLKLKIHLIQAYYDLSDRQTEEKIIGDLFIKRFLGLSVEFFGFDHSTIALDRGRMGAVMYQACHLYILAQMYRLGLWGDRDEQWIIDSFPTHAGVLTPRAYRLIQQAMLRVLGLLKRHLPSLYRLAEQTLVWDGVTRRLSTTSPNSERLLAFSKLVVQAYALLSFLETERAAALLKSSSEATQERLMERRAILSRILEENSRPLPPQEPTDKPDGTPEAKEEADPLPTAAPDASMTPDPQKPSPSAEAEGPQFEKIPASERPADRIYSASSPEVRIGKKTARKKILGFKVQNLCTCGGVILNTRVIPANEHDREAMLQMVQDLRHFFRRTPAAVIGDSAYGHGKQRLLLHSQDLALVAPLPEVSNPTGRYPLSQFTYHPEQDQFTCPNQKQTVRKHSNSKLEGTQYFFDKEDCRNCPLRDECTTSQKGRTVFRSDYVDFYERAADFNASEQGQEMLRRRWVVERKNQEMKNDCGLGAPRTANPTTLSIKAITASIAVNLKLVVRSLIAPKPGFLRRAKEA